MEIQQVKIEKLNPSKYNPRVMDDETMARLEKNIAKFGMVEPIVANKDNAVIGGHQRLEAAKKLGWKEVPVVYVDLDKKQEKLLNLALNRIVGDWDQKKLGDLVSDISELELDTELTGFGEVELNQILNAREFKLFETDEDIDKLSVEDVEDKLKHNERVPLCFWTDKKEDYDLIFNYFKTSRKKNLDTQKLIKLIKKGGDKDANKDKKE